MQGPLPKICVICSKNFSRPKGYGFVQFEKQKCCSYECRIIRMKQEKIGFQKGHQGYSNKTIFQKGFTPWNKGVKLGLQPYHKIDHLKQYQGITKGIKYSSERIEKMRLSRLGKPCFKTRGEKNWNWKGGTTPLRKKVQATQLYRDWRSKVYERDDWTCVMCKVRGGKLHADHIKPYARIISDNKITSLEEAKMCSELWDIQNGRTLCVPCHMKTDTYGGKTK